MLEGKRFLRTARAKTFSVKSLILSPKSLVVVFLIAFLMGYQPVLGIPPLKKNLVHAQAEQIQSLDAAKLPFEFQLPHPGYITTRFSSYHPGIDIATGLGMPVKPIAPGKVVDEGFNFWGLGLNVVVDHGNGYKSVYAHMGSIYVKKDQDVTEDDDLGTVGLTGHTSGPHTHLEISKDGNFFDPLTVLPQIREIPVAEDFKPVVEQPKIQKINKESKSVDFKKQLQISL